MIVLKLGETIDDSQPPSALSVLSHEAFSFIPTFVKSLILVVFVTKLF